MAVKPILQIYPVLPAADEEERARLRPLGRNVERYQSTIDGLTDIVKAADELGFWGLSTIEHHFHSEGYEVGPAPALLNAYWAAITSNVRVGQLGYTMSAQNPLRVAEEVAVLDHLTKGRCFCGFSRGYQARWTNVLGQHLGTRATLSPRGAPDETVAEMGQDAYAAQLADDQINRRIFEEQVDMVIEAWTQPSVSHDSALWQVPYPFERGLEWGMAPVTERLGAPGEVGEDGRVHRISVVPAPYTQPHPPVFVASNASLETVEYCARKGFIPAYFSPVKRAAPFAQAYMEQARAAGYDFTSGQNQAVVRWMQVARTAEDAYRAVERYDVEIYRNLYKALTPVMPYDPTDPVGSVKRCGLWYVGSVNEVQEQFISQWKIVPAEYVVLIFHYAQQPKDSVIANLEIFMNRIKPALDEFVESAQDAAIPTGI